jgi:hypothetical protein
MEGYRDIFWQGDKIVWKNFFKHYLLCIEHVYSLYVICGEEHAQITERDIPVYKCYDNLPTPHYKTLFDNIFKEFYDVVGGFVEKISTRSTPIRRDELYCYLTAVHYIAMEIIKSNYEKKGLIPKQEVNKNKKPINLNHLSKMIDAIEEGIKKENWADKISKIFEIQKFIYQDIYLTNSCTGTINRNDHNKNFLVIDFVEKYIAELEKLLYSKLYVACFMTECNNSSVWGHYGDGHKGVCLIFESEKEKAGFSIKLNGKIGSGSKGVIYGDRNYQFLKIKYDEGFSEIDYFKLIGRLPLPILLKTWYQDENGNLSEVANDILKDNDAWMKKYWDYFYKNINIKTQDWHYEEEYRLVISGLLDDEIEEKYRSLKYNFSSLKGIIFGIKTSRENKTKIIEIIQQKCKECGRTDFKFYQAYYCPEKKNIQNREVTLFTKSDEDNEIIEENQ